MKNKLKLIIIVLVLLNFQYAEGVVKKNSWPNLKGPYLGQKTPGINPEIFAPGIISTEEIEGCIGWGNNMEYFIFQRRINRKSQLYITYRTNNIWSKPEHIKSVDKYRVGDFTITPDGKRIVFGSKIFIKEIGPGGEGANIWSINIGKDKWSIPKPMGPHINTIYHESYPCLSSNNNLYFFSRKPGGFGDSDIYISRFINGRYSKPVNSGSNINTKYDEWDTYIAPDESFMIYCSTKPEGLGKDDLYISYKNNRGVWSKPVHMGNKINSKDSENRPYISPDGKYLFYAGIKKGNRDIYWVSSKIIDDLKLEVYKGEKCTFCKPKSIHSCLMIIGKNFK